MDFALDVRLCCRPKRGSNISKVETGSPQASWEICFSWPTFLIPPPKATFPLGLGIQLSLTPGSASERVLDLFSERESDRCATLGSKLNRVRSIQLRET